MDGQVPGKEGYGEVRWTEIVLTNVSMKGNASLRLGHGLGHGLG